MFEYIVNAINKDIAVKRELSQIEKDSIVKNLETKAMIIDANGSYKFVEPKNKKKFSYEELSQVVGGLIEFFYFYDGKKQKHSKYSFICNEEGLLKGLDVNLTIYANFKRYIAGTVLIIPNKYLS